MFNVASSLQKSPTTYWSTITWTLLHIFPKALTQDFYNQHRENILNLLYEICVNVPCPICSKHARHNLGKYNFFHKSINKTPEDLANNIFKFHNEVNKMLGKPLFDASHLKQYDDLDFIEVYTEWSDRYSIKGRDLRMTSHKQGVNRAKSDFIRFVNPNVQHMVIKRTFRKDVPQPQPPQPLPRLRPSNVLPKKIIQAHNSMTGMFKFTTA